MGKNKKIPKVNPNEHLLLGIKKDEEDIKKYEKLLKLKKRKNKSKLEELFYDLDPLSYEENFEEETEEKMDTGQDVSCEEMDQSEDESSESKVKGLKTDIIVSEEQLTIKRNILAHFNRLCESQMMKCLDGVENIWNEYPRGDVRDIFIRESINYMKLSCIELAAFVASLHFRLIKQTNLIAFYMEYLVEKLTGIKSSSWANESTYTTVMVGYKFIAYITRLEVIDTNLIIDLMGELITQGCEIPQLKILSEIASIIGFFLKKHNLKRCDEFVATFKDKNKANMTVVSDLNELRSFSEAIIDKLTTSKAKNDVVFDSMVKYRKLMRTWCRRAICNENLALRLGDFRGENRVRWWLVGSAVNPNVVHNKNAVAMETATAAAVDKLLENVTVEELQWNELAVDLGFVTEGKQRLFCQLMRGKSVHSNDGGISDTLVQIHKLSNNGANPIVPEAEVVGVVMRCLALEKEFCQFYVDLLVGMMEANRRCRQLTKCAIWDLLAQPKLVESARINIGRCLGQLIGAAGFPVNSLRKFNFLDSSSPNVKFMMAVVTEIVEESWEDICDLLQEMLTSISAKFANNLRIFLKKNFRDNSDGKLNKTVVVKVNKCIEYLVELRKKGQ